MTEWSMTSSPGMSGLILAGSPPKAAIASRMATRSTTHGTPVKSCSSTRAGVYAISLPRAAPGSHDASALTRSAQAVLITGQVLQQHLQAVGKPARAVNPVEPVDHVRGVADGEPVAGAETVRGHVGSGATSPMACRANVEWAYAPPARISEATQIASMISSGLAPLRRASLVCPVMQ